MGAKVNFSLTQIEYVLAVHKHGHFAKAAAACYVTQPTLSMQIQKLEEELGAVIFDRSKKPILLTQAGKSIIDQLQIILNEAKKVEGLIKLSMHSSLKGELIVGVIPTIAPYLLPLLLPTVEKSFPDMQLQIFEMQTSEIIKGLNSDEIDVGILALPLQISKIFELPLYFEPFSVLCKKNHEMAHFKKVEYSKLKFNDIWLLEEGHCLRNQILDVCALAESKIKKRKFKFESGSLETLKNLVNSYGGYTLVPELALTNIGDVSSVIHFDRPVPSRQVGLVYRREHYKNDLIEALGESIVASLPESIKKLRQKDLDIIPIE